nr:reverse transcriptase domain-containing protein [Tanacetum cinerariifolium]
GCYRIMSSSNYPIIVPSDSNNEDAFSSTNSVDYTLTSPDYFPAATGNTFPNPSVDLSKYLLASLAISPFHDDPNMKVMQAYNATSNESLIPPQTPIAPPTVLPSSLVLSLSPMFDPRDFFIPEEILLSQKRDRSRSSSSTSALPQIFETRESSHKTHLERNEEQIETILNHLDELLLKISTLEMIIKDIQVLHRSDKKSLLDNILLCPTMMPNSEKLMEVFIGGLPRSIEGNVTASKPQTLEEAITITQRISTLEMIIKDIQVLHRSDKKSLLDKIRELKNHKGGPPDYKTRSLSLTAFV